MARSSKRRGSGFTKAPKATTRGRVDGGASRSGDIGRGDVGSSGFKRASDVSKGGSDLSKGGSNLSKGESDVLCSRPRTPARSNASTIRGVVMNAGLLLMTLVIVGLLGLSVIGGSLDFGTSSVPLRKTRCTGGDCGRSGQSVPHDFNKRATEARDLTTAPKPTREEIYAPRSIGGEVARMGASSRYDYALLERIRSARKPKETAPNGFQGPFALPLEAGTSGTSAVDSQSD